MSYSSSKAEYRCLATTIANVAWIQHLLCDLGVFLKTPPILYCDNLSATFLASNPIIHNRTRHVDVDYHFIREHVLQGTLQIWFLCSEAQLADHFTKGSSAAGFKLLCNKLTVDGSTAQLEGGCLAEDLNLLELLICFPFLYIFSCI